jgi:xylulose-5-phosphate/fructose-6-phosphate phosphoketolase
VRGFKEKGTTTTPFDMLMLNDLDRYRLAMDVIRHVPGLGERYAGLAQHFDDERARHRAFAYEHGIDSPDVLGWNWIDPRDGGPETFITDSLDTGADSVLGA